MIKLPKPFRKQGQQLCNDGNTDMFFDAYTEAQLKQAISDVLQVAKSRIEALLSDASRGDCADAIRALIKEIDA